MIFENIGNHILTSFLIFHHLLLLLSCDYRLFQTNFSSPPLYTTMVCINFYIKSYLLYIKMNDEVVEIILTALGISASFFCFCYVVFNNHFCLFIDEMKKNMVEAEIV
jgi:hypothetical protein